MYTLEADMNLQICLQTQSQYSSISLIFPLIQTNAPSPTKDDRKEELSEDDWGYLDFKPSFNGRNKMYEFETQNIYLNTCLDVDYGSLKFNTIPPKSNSFPLNISTPISNSAHG